MTPLIIHTFSVLAFTAVIADLYSLWFVFSLSAPTSHLPWNDEIYCKEHLQPGKCLSDIHTINITPSQFTTNRTES